MLLGEQTNIRRRLGASWGAWGASWAVLERPGSVLARPRAVLVAFKVVLDVKMSFESVQDPKTLKNRCFFKVFGRVPRRLGASWGVWGASLGVLERPGSVLGRLGAVLVALKVVLDVKMSFESVQDPKS